MSLCLPWRPDPARWVPRTTITITPPAPPLCTLFCHPRHPHTTRPDQLRPYPLLLCSTFRLLPATPYLLFLCTLFSALYLSPNLAMPHTIVNKYTHTHTGRQAGWLEAPAAPQLTAASAANRTCCCTASHTAPLYCRKVQFCVQISSNPGAPTCGSSGSHTCSSTGSQWGQRVCGWGSESADALLQNSLWKKQEGAGTGRLKGGNPRSWQR